MVLPLKLIFVYDLAGTTTWDQTSLFSDQERMAGEVCRAFETAGAKPPAELKAMFEKFKAEMAAQGKEVHLGGKGLVFHLQ